MESETESPISQLLPWLPLSNGSCRCGGCGR